VTLVETGEAYGVMGLRNEWPRYDLGRGAALAGATADDAAADRDLNVLAGAYVIAQSALNLGGGQAPAPDDTAAWIAAAADVLGGGAGYAVAAARDDLAAALRGGAARTLPDGETVTLTGRAFDDGAAVGVVSEALADYPGAAWSPAYSGNYTNGRSGTAIDTVVIHTTQGSYSGAISWFMNPAAMVSAHFVVRSGDGAVTQCVDLADTAWHAGNWSYNLRSVGIEHEGFVDDPSWYTDAMYMSSAALTAWLADTYGIPTDRAHIIGHVEVPGSTHTDPGPNWDWDYYMSLVNAPDLPPLAATLTTMDYPDVMISGEERVAWVEYANDGSQTWDAQTRLGTSNPHDRESPFYHPANWIGPNRPTAADVAAGPGDTSRFSFVLLAPDVAAPTDFTEYFNLVQEGVEWFGPCDDCVALTIRVVPAVGDPGDPGDPGPGDPGGPAPDEPPLRAAGCACAAVGASGASGSAGGAGAGAGAGVGPALAVLGAVLGLARRRARRHR